MKKKNIILSIVIIVILVIALIALGIFYAQEKKKEYSVQKITNYEYFVGKKEGKYGVINVKGEFLIDPLYEDIQIPNPTKDLFICHKENETKILDKEGQELLTKYEEIQPLKLKNISSDLQYEKNVLKYKINEKYGLLNFNGKELTKPIYDEIETLPYKEGELLVTKEQKQGVINQNGYVLIPTKYDKIEVDRYYTQKEGYHYAGYIICNTTEEGYRYGYLNYHQKVILQPEYNEIKRINDIEDNKNAYLLCAKNGRYGIKKNQEEVIANSYQSISFHKENQIFLLEKGKRFGIITLEGKDILPIEYSQIDMTGDYFYAKNFENQIEVFDQEGKQTNISPDVSYLNIEKENYQIRIENQEGKTWYSIVKEGQTITQKQYTYLGYLFQNYFIACQENGKLGIIDEQENIKLEFQYDSIQKIQDQEMIQAISNESQVTKIYNASMKMVCEMIDPKIEVEEEYTKVYNIELKEKYYMNHSGERIEVKEFGKEPKTMIQKIGDQWKITDQEGKQIGNTTYDYITDLNRYGFAGFLKEGKWGVMNQEGSIILEPTYEIETKEEPQFIGNYYQVTYGYGEIYYTDGN